MSSTIPEFSKRHKFSRQHFYNMEARGEAPRTIAAGRSRRISDEAEAEWVREREAANKQRRARKATAKRQTTFP